MKGLEGEKDLGCRVREEEAACQNLLVEAHGASSVAGPWEASSAKAWGACQALEGASGSAAGAVVGAFCVGAEVALLLVLYPKALVDFEGLSQVKVLVELGCQVGLDQD